MLVTPNGTAGVEGGGPFTPRSVGDASARGTAPATTCLRGRSGRKADALSPPLRTWRRPMGIIRKTLSVTTLGVVGWKSKKELLAETESDLAAARADLAETPAVRAALQERLESVEHKLKGSQLHARHEANSASSEEHTAA